MITFAQWLTSYLRTIRLTGFILTGCSDIVTLCQTKVSLICPFSIYTRVHAVRLKLTIVLSRKSSQFSELLESTSSTFEKKIYKALNDRIRSCLSCILFTYFMAIHTKMTKWKNKENSMEMVFCSLDCFLYVERVE